MMWPAAVLALLLALGHAAPARADDVTFYDEVRPLPSAVAAAIMCDRVDSGGMARPFAGGFVFSARCPSNHANEVKGLVFAEDAEGNGAKTLLFPYPKGADPADSLSNVRFYPQSRELTELWVNPEDDICRTEGRWRLEGAARAPRLIYWRETRDCDGKRGWRVLIDRRRG
ncbi:MAG TPA: hypothetical protein VLA00_14020 [Xanthobacteraceae bacterium]|nr:hypothetical protein [Xanthobacteraceae bacterium]